ncbi:MAG: hypothetical protein LBU94_00330 [Clostridiales bacterium]|jgi:hypothetical protein|nr:hypothetical protein [Clostridiales bacterium]
MTGYKNLYTFADSLSIKINSLYKGSPNERVNILALMDANDWFGTEYIIQDRIPWISENDILKIQEPLVLWLSAYRKPGRDKIALILKRFASVYPDTCRLYSRFLTDKNLYDKTSAWKLLDFMLSEMDKDISAYDDNGIENLIRRIESKTTRAVARLFSDFLNTTERYGKPLSQWHYSFNSRENIMLVNDAYSLEDFSVMAYCVFNQEMWKRQGLVEKAVNNKVYADLWLFIAFHFVCALRSGDIERIPAPALPYCGESILAKISCGTFTEQEAAALSDELCIRLKVKPLKPSKTAMRSNVPDLKLFVPESLKAPLGTIIALVLAHHPEIRPGGGFIKPSDRLSSIREFFGENFLNAIGRRRFSSRRCNKSYLQGIELTGNGEPGKPKGYMLAALARSHISGIGKLAETTEIYLKDARFSGYSPKFIIKQMFERGVFSFIPAALLEIYAGIEYTKLPVAAQTKLIGELGLTAYQIEGLAEATARAMIRSRKSVADVIKNPSGLKENVGIMLQNIATGYATGKQPGFLCLITATGKNCPYSGRGGCIGCGYEIATKTAMYTLMREYVRLANIIRDASSADAHRYTKIIEQAIMPAAAEMLASAKLLYPGADVSGLLDIMEVELSGVNIGAGGTERRIQPSVAYP